MQGSLPSQSIERLIATGGITGTRGVAESQIQPGALDLTVGVRGWRVEASFLPQRGETIAQLLQRFALFELDLTKPTLLEKGAIYLFEANESLALPPEVYGCTENKSSTGRIDLQVRTLVDGVPRFDRMPAGYRGPLYLEVTPRSFMVELAHGVPLNQLRLFQGDADLSDDEILALHRETSVLNTKDGAPMDLTHHLGEGGIFLTADLDLDIIGYRAKRTNAILSMLQIAKNPMEQFFDPIPRPKDGHILLHKDDFTILCSAECFRVPPAYSVQMTAYDTASGEFRSHYAGFFDPGFGFGDGSIPGSSAVLELRAHGDDFLLRAGQPVCKMVFTRMAEFPDRVYGASDKLESNYARQRGPKLSKYFTAPSPTLL